MLMRPVPSLFRFASAVALLLVIAGCTPGGQFDPTVLFANDMFDSKKKLPGEREPVFPSGVPGTSTGVPQDLVKGYQPPPDQATADTAASGAAAPPAEKPKPKPKPKLARAPASTAQDPAFNRKPAQSPTRISIGPTPKRASPVQQNAGSSQSVWPTPQGASSQQTAAPGAPSQSVWPASPQSAPAQQPSQSIWPNPPAPATPSQ